MYVCINLPLCSGSDSTVGRLPFCLGVEPLIRLDGKVDFSEETVPPVNWGMFVDTFLGKLGCFPLSSDSALRLLSWS